MSPWKKPLLLVALLLALVTSASRLTAAEKLNLDRITPVPETEPIPVMDFFRSPLFTRPKLNPAGTHFVALVETGNDHTAMLICDLANMKASVISGSGDKDVSSVAWLDKTHILSSLLSEKLYAAGLYVTDAVHTNNNYAVELYSAVSLISVPQDSSMKPLVWIYRNAYDEGTDAGVFQIDAAKALGRNHDSMPGTMQARLDAEEQSGTTYGTRASVLRRFPAPSGTGLVIDYLADKEGQLAFSITAQDGFYTLYRMADKKWEKCPVDLDAIMPIDVGNLPNEMIVVSPREDGKPRALQMLDAATGQLGDVICQDKAYDITSASIVRQAKTGAVLGIKYHRSRLTNVWYDENYRTVQKLLEGRFPNQVVQILGSDDEERRFFVSAYSDCQPPTYYSLDLQTRTLGLVKNTAPWIDSKRMQPMNLMKFKTRDGRTLDAYVTLPAGASAQNPAPLVVLPHGGPWVRDSWGFDGEVQFLASRGYAVMQPNYRGSPGYNWMFPISDQWEFRKMHDDVTDAVKTLVASKLVDPQRMAIMGTSFGGYLAACGATFEPDLYRCAVAVAGVFDWQTMMKAKKSEQYENAGFGIFSRNLGDPVKQKEKFDEISPLRHVNQIRIPVFVAHGKEDAVVDIGESRRLIAELNKHHVAYEVMLAGGEGHGMARLKNQVELYTRIEAFLAKHLAPVKAATAAGTP